MTQTSVLDIDVNDEQFQRFKALFDEYRQHVQEMPGAWKGTAGATGEVADACGLMTAALLAQTKLLTEMIEQGQQLTAEEREQAREAKAAADAKREQAAAEKAVTAEAKAQAEARRREAEELRKAAGKAKDIATSIGSASLSVLKWGLFGGLVGGAGGLFGLEHLANSALSQRRDSRGYGVSAGALNAVRTDFSPYGDADKLLGGIADVQSNVADSWIATVNGIKNPDAPPDQQVPGYLDALRQVYKETRSSPGLLDPMMHARGLDSMFTPETARYWGSLSDSEVKSTLAHMQADTKSLNVGDVDLKAWQQFDVQLSRAGTSIENAFIRGLSPLAPQLTKLSEILTGMVTSALSGNNGKRLMDDLAAGLKWVNAELSDPKLGQKIREAANDFDFFVNKTRGWLQTFHLLPSDADAAAVKLGGNSNDKAPEQTVRQGFRQIGLMMGSHMTGVDSEGRIFGDAYFNPLTAKGFEVSAMPDAMHAAPILGAIDAKNGLIPGTLSALYGQESTFGKRLLNHDHTALGPFQFEAPTARQYGVTNPMDFQQEADAAGRYMADLTREFHGDTRKAFAAFNWGQGHLEDDIKKYGATWEAHLPAETANYVRQTAAVVAKGGAAPGQRTTVEVRNNTGGAATTTIRQAAM